MKIEQARATYNIQLRQYQEKKLELAKQKESLDIKINSTPNGKEVYANEAATLELTINAVHKKSDEYHKYMEKLMEQHALITNMESAKQQGEAMGDAMEDMGKIMEIARRLMKGDIVPAFDERKLMEFDDELYQAAKNIGRMRERMERKEHESLWEDEEPTEIKDSAEIADNTEAFASGPEIVSVEETVASVDAPSSSSTSVIL